MDAITTHHLLHRFGARTAVNDLTFSVPTGEVFGLLGPNGAGKTTTVRLLNGLYQPSGGEMRVLDLDPVTQGPDVRRASGVLTETPAMYERLTAWQNLDFFAALAGMTKTERDARIRELLGFFELSERAAQRVGAFSKGMKQRLALARSLLNRPRILFLDEPTSGLDPEAALQVRDLILSIRAHDGHTVFLCTHNLDEAERLCDRMAIMNEGRFLAVGTLDELRRRISPGLWVQIDLWNGFDAAVEPGVRALRGVLDVRSEAHALRVRVEEEAVVPTLLSYVVGQGVQVFRVQPQQVTLEEIYFTLQAGAA